MSAKACIYLAALIGVTAVAQPPVDSIDVILEDNGKRDGKILNDAAIADFKQLTHKFQLQLKAAVALGEAAANHDIKAHRFRLRDCGKPVGTREVDSDTGYMLEWIGPCDHVDTLFKAEVKAYNRTMLAWHAKHPKHRE